MKKHMLLGASLLLLTMQFGACKKENLQDSGTAQVQPANQQRTGLTVDFNYKLYAITNNGGGTDYKCLKPKDDCSKVKSVVSPERDAQEAALDLAIANNEVSDFFQTLSNYDAILPNLKDQTTWRDQLVDGSVALIKKKYPADGILLYMAYNPLANPANIAEKDVAFAIEVTDSE
ncbi:MAG TPA: hypothetical protein VF868_03300 [Bacteroidia bacterium]|jgi:hypothetical protein